LVGTREDNQMVQEYDFSKSTGRCSVTGRAFKEGEAYYAALFETEEGFERRDFSLETWSEPPAGCFCHWRARVPEQDPKKEAVTVDLALLTNLFLRLEGEESETKQQLRFVLALLLIRKRLLKNEQTLRKDDEEYWEVRFAKEENTCLVRNPQLSGEEVDRLSAQLTAILGGNVEAVDDFECPSDTSATSDQTSPPGSSLDDRDSSGNSSALQSGTADAEDVHDGRTTRA
jgi:hypothetical protein